MAIFSSLLLFGVDCMIKSQHKARSPTMQRKTRSTSLSSCDNSPTSDSGYKETESQPMLEDNCTNKPFSTHDTLTIHDLLRVVDRETVL